MTSAKEPRLIVLSQADGTRSDTNGDVANGCDIQMQYFAWNSGSDLQKEHPEPAETDDGK